MDCTWTFVRTGRRHHKGGREITDDDRERFVFPQCLGSALGRSWVCLGSENALLLRENLRLRPRVRRVARDGFAKFLLLKNCGRSRANWKASSPRAPPPSRGCARRTVAWRARCGARRESSRSGTRRSYPSRVDLERGALIHSMEAPRNSHP